VSLNQGKKKKLVCVFWGYGFAMVFCTTSSLSWLRAEEMCEALKNLATVINNLSPLERCD
jgi:hypothetical protein